MQWIGIDILMFVQYKHELMEAEQIIDPTKKYPSQQQKRLREKERDRQAIRNRMHFYEFTEVHDGKEKFPYEAIDLAFFI